eukprot:TRINITY_DN29231_c0_g1_i1.p3 TRINITY_DN29231_c0_g1~~TRINITY_DN29231_c0_g1_i1.p3  ORF type:complete len:169 (+),score=6.52 TRINITY_DN29231_c0_g1_i1:72-578(+)
MKIRVNFYMEAFVTKKWRENNEQLAVVGYSQLGMGFFWVWGKFIILQQFLATFLQKCDVEYERIYFSAKFISGKQWSRITFSPNSFAHSKQLFGGMAVLYVTPTFFSCTSLIQLLQFNLFYYFCNNLQIQESRCLTKIDTFCMSMSCIFMQEFCLHFLRFFHLEKFRD